MSPVARGIRQARWATPAALALALLALSIDASCAQDRAARNRPGDREIGSLVHAVQGKDPAVRRDAARSLGTYGPTARSAVPALIAALNANDWQLRALAADALVRIDPDPDRVAPPLIETFAEDASADYRNAVIEPVARALATLGRGAVPHLRRALADPRFTVRLGAAEALGALGPDAQEALPALASAVRDDDHLFVRTAAAQALERIDPDQAPDLARPLIDALVSQLGSDDPLERLDAATALREMGPAAAAAVPALMERLRDEQRAIRMAAMYALGAVGSAAAPAVPALAAALDDPDEGIQDAARRALRGIRTAEARAALEADSVSQ